jgi:hypothetical protein
VAPAGTEAAPDPWTGALEGAARTAVFAEGAGAGLEGAADEGAGAAGGADGAAGAVAGGLTVLDGVGVGVAEGSHPPRGINTTGPQGSASAGAAIARAVEATRARTARAVTAQEALLRVRILDILRSTDRRLGISGRLRALSALARA